MKKLHVLLLIAILLGTGWAAQTPTTQKPVPGGYIVEHDSEIQRTEPGPHSGGGQTTAYSFFEKTPKLDLIFRKRALKPPAWRLPIASVFSVIS